MSSFPLFFLAGGLTLANAEEPADAEADVPESADPSDESEAAEASSEPEPAPVVDAFLSETLPNGLKVSILADPDLPVVATQLWVQVGSAHEADAEAGFAHLFEHLMFGDTTTYAGEDYARHHTVNGGSENAYTSFDNTVYISQIRPGAHDQVLVYEADRMVNLVLDQENLDNEKKIVTEELRLRTENDPFSRLLGPALETLFGDHPYSRSPVGTKEDIDGADLELVRKFYEGYYHPANMHLVVVGPVVVDSVMQRVSELFGEVDKERLTPPEVPSLTSLETGGRRVLKEDIPPMKVAALVYYGPTRRHADYWAWKVMTEMLAGGEVDHFREELVTKQGKALDGGALAEELAAGSLLGFGSVSLPFRSKGKAFKILHGVEDVMSEGDWLTADSLETVRRRLLQDELRRSYYAASMADALGTAYAWQGDDSLALQGSAEAIDSVSLEQVGAAWKTYVDEAQPIELFIKRGKPDRVPEELPTTEAAADGGEA